jgi:hypothetical protein
MAHRYGAHHKSVRRRFEPLVAAGQVTCWRCLEQIPPGASWDLGHVDDPVAERAFGPLSPEHRSCNRGTSRIWKERATGRAVQRRDPAGRFTRRTSRAW